jgi:hypothetical protein
MGHTSVWMMGAERAGAKEEPKEGDRDFSSLETGTSIGLLVSPKNLAGGKEGEGTLVLQQDKASNKAMDVPHCAHAVSQRTARTSRPVNCGLET